MGEPEIILNLWHVFDGTGVIYSLRIRAYVHDGSDEEKLAFLQRFARTDYLIARPFPIPERFHTTVVDGKAKKKMPVMPVQLLETQGGPVTAGSLFDEVMKQIEKDLPAQTKLSIPEDPLICITGLYADDDGNIRPQLDGVLRADTAPNQSQRPYKGYPPPLPTGEEQIRQQLRKDKSLVKQAIKLWFESNDDEKKTRPPSETELISLVKANFSAKTRPV